MSKVSASSLLCVSRVEGTQLLPLVSVTMNFPQLFCWTLVMIGSLCSYMCCSVSTLMFERNAFREIFWIKVVSMTC